MALKTINDLTAKTSPAATDLVGVWDVSGGAMKKSTLVQIVAGAATAALKAATNTFTKTQTFAPDSAANAITVTPSQPTCIELADAALGAAAGPRITLGRNTSAGAQAAGHILFRLLSGNERYVYVDVGGIVRVHNVAPVNAEDTNGTVVGAQTSHEAFKTVLGEPLTPAEILVQLAAAAETVKRFRYTDGRMNNEEYSGIVLSGDTRNRYGADVSPEYPAGKMLDEATLFGDLVIAITNLAERVSALEA